MKIIKPFTKPLFFSVMLYAVIIHSCDRKDKTVGDITLDSMMLDSITENERTTGYQPGFGLVESTILEKNGDHAGAVIAAFKELCWARAFSTDNELSLELMQKGLAGVKELYTTDGVKTVQTFQRTAALAAIDSAVLFLNGEYKAAGELLERTFPNAEPDSFVRWMKLVCILESGNFTQHDQRAYSTIKQRYALFPAYWYHGARTMPEYLAGEYATHCINTAPRGVFADEARKILASKGRGQ